MLIHIRRAVHEDHVGIHCYPRSVNARRAAQDGHWLQARPRSWPDTWRPISPGRNKSSTGKEHPLAQLIHPRCTPPGWQYQPRSALLAESESWVPRTASPAVTTAAAILAGGQNAKCGRCGHSRRYAVLSSHAPKLGAADRHANDEWQSGTTRRITIWTRTEPPNCAARGSSARFNEAYRWPN
jgi:hypothetical protein